MPGRDPWQTETGLLDDFDITITESRFGYDERYMSGEVCLLLWTGTTDNADVPEVTQLIPLGGGWTTEDNGKTVVHESGKERNFNRSSVYGRIIDRCIKEFGIGDLLRAKGSPFEAKTWEGLRFHMKQEDLSYGEGIGTKQRVMPVEFLGEAEEGGTAKAAAPAKAASAGATAAAGGGWRDDKGMMAKLKVAAKKSADGDAFIDAALEVDGVTAHDDLVEAITDGSLYGELS